MWGIELNPAKVIDHNNHLNFFRLLFALQVVYSHSSEWLKIHEGREEDYTYDENNNLIAPAIVTFPFKQLKFIEAAKIVQNDINSFELILEIVVDQKDENLKKEVDNLIKDFYKIYGDKANFEIIFTNKIPLGKSGKFRWIECKIK